MKSRPVCVACAFCAFEFFANAERRGRGVWGDLLHDLIHLNLLTHTHMWTIRIQCLEKWVSATCAYEHRHAPCTSHATHAPSACQPIVIFILMIHSLICTLVFRHWRFSILNFQTPCRKMFKFFSKNELHILHDFKTYLAKIRKDLKKFSTSFVYENLSIFLKFMKRNRLKPLYHTFNPVFRCNTVTVMWVRYWHVVSWKTRKCILTKRSASAGDIIVLKHMYIYAAGYYLLRFYFFEWHVMSFYVRIAVRSGT